MNTPSRTVLILGANGRFGAAAVEAFAAAGWTVLAQARRAPPWLPAGARHIAAPLQDTHRLALESAGASVVVHAINPPYTAWKTEALPLARAGMDVAQRLGARFMLPGNVYAYGQHMPALLTEHTPTAPTGPKGRIRQQLEAEIAARADAGLQATVIRAGDFFGAGSGNWFDRVIVKSLRQGKLVYPGPPDVPHAWAYLPDLARAFVAVAQAPAPAAFETLHFEGHTLTGAALLQAIEAAARTLGIAPPRALRHGGMPWGLIRAGGWLVPMWRELAEMAYLWRVPHALDGTALRRRTGPVANTALADALRTALAATAAAQAGKHAIVAPLPPPGPIRA